MSLKIKILFFSSAICLLTVVPCKAQSQTATYKKTLAPANDYKGDWRKVSAASIVETPSSTADKAAASLTPEQLITGLYNKVLGRDPDAGGLAYWTDVYKSGKMSLKDIKDAFYQSPEFESLTPEQKITALYRDILNREPDPGGLSSWTGKYIAGEDIKDIRAEFYASQEYLNYTAMKMPTLPGSGQTDPNGNITVTFASGNLSKSSLSGLWAEVKYDDQTEYWNITPDALSSDGTSVTLKMPASLDGKKVELKLFGFNTVGDQTNLTNAVAIQVSSKPSDIAMPTLPESSQTDLNGNIAVKFTSGSLSKNQLSGLWAEVKHDGKTEYWDIKPDALSADGTSVNLKMPTSLDGKTVELTLYGFDTAGKQTLMTNTSTIQVSSKPSDITMPTLQGNGQTDPNGNIAVKFTSGSLSKNQLSGLWAEVKHDGKTEYWDIKPDALSADGTSVNLKMPESLDGKTVELTLYGFDTGGKQTLMTNTSTIQVFSKPSDIAMPTLPESGKTDFSGNITVTFSSGSLSRSSLSGLWAEVKYDGKTEYWDITPYSLSANGTSVTLEMPGRLYGKTVGLTLYGFDTGGKQTLMTNTSTIQVF